MAGGRGVVRPDIARAKRAGLDLDLDRVCAAGARALETDDHYRLKTHGVCAQRHDDLFMVRLRVAGGQIGHDAIAALGAAAREHAGGWVHLTTRQNIELHSVRLEDVPAVYRRLQPFGLVGRSSCGHTIRNIVACPNATTSVDEPFDVSVDASWLSRELVARSRELNVRLPSRINISLGGCPDCGIEALTNDIGLVACVRDGEPGYQLWAGGSLGTAPRLSMMLRPFVTRDELWPAVWTIIEWFCNEVGTDQSTRARLKVAIDACGEPAFRAAFAKGFATACGEPHPNPPAVELHAANARELSLARAPTLGWRDGIEPERTPGYASVTVRVPLGDLLADELEEIARVAPTGELALTRAQNILIRSVPVEHVPAVVGALADLALGPDGARGAVDVRACPGLAFCSLAITASQPIALAIERALQVRPDLPRDVTIAVSGCPNACTKHQAADVGLAGTKVKAGGRIAAGYQLYLGADLAAGLAGEPVLRLLDDEVPDAVVATIETWTALRRPGELPGTTFRRAGLGVVSRAVELRLREFGRGDRPAGAEPTTLAVAS